MITWLIFIILKISDQAVKPLLMLQLRKVYSQAKFLTIDIRTEIIKELKCYPN